jgi:hypothetical protein
MKYLKHQLVERDSSQEVSLNKSFGEYAERLSLVNEERGKQQRKRDRAEARKDLPLGPVPPSKPSPGPGRFQRAKAGAVKYGGPAARGAGKFIKDVVTQDLVRGREGPIERGHQAFRRGVDRLAYKPKRDSDGNVMYPNQQSMQTDPKTGRRGMMDTRFKTKDDNVTYETDELGEKIPDTTGDKTSRTAYDTEAEALRDRSSKGRTVLAKGVNAMADVAGAFESPIRREVYGSYGQNVPAPPGSKAAKKGKGSGGLGDDESERDDFDEVDDEGGR